MAPLGREERALVFIGFMGAGKSEALETARARGHETIDVDELLVRELGMPIAEFFDAHGEEEFRRRESTLVVNLIGRPDGPRVAAAGCVVALGGGAVLAENVREYLTDHVVVWLDVDTATAWERVRASARPLARDHARFAALLAERTSIYERLADAVVAGERGLVARAFPALEALWGLPLRTRMAWGSSSSGEYPAYVGPGLLDEVLPALRDTGMPALAGSGYAITDEVVGPLYAERLGPLGGTVLVPPDEGAKTLAEAERVLGELAGLGATRSDHLLALGGGVVGDLAGFCAATYQRGVSVVQLPTTLLAQVDSAYGGKTGVDLPQAKNYVGAYHQPAAVLADTATLATLPAAELAAGFVEVLKTALIAGGELWERARAVEALAPAGLDELIFACARTKLDVVAVDERDSGRRQVLNLGHTVGHAIETASGYGRYRHGEAVGLGLLAALRLSGADELRDEVADALARIGLPTRLDPAIDSDEIFAALERDKKRDAEGVRFVLLERPGEPRIGQRVDAASVRAAVEELR